MTLAQWDMHIKRSFGTPLNKLGKQEDDEIDGAETDAHRELSIGYQESATTTLYRGNLKRMWSFETKIIKEKQDVPLLLWYSSGSRRMVFDGENSQPCQVQNTGVKELLSDRSSIQQASARISGC